MVPRQHAVTLSAICLRATRAASKGHFGRTALHLFDDVFCGEINSMSAARVLRHLCHFSVSVLIFDGC
jgi:hypothetical protein